MNRQRLTLFIRLGLSVVLIGLLFSLIDRRHFVEHLRSLDVSYFLIGLLCYIISVVLWSVRWYLFIRATGEPATLWRVFKTTITGIFFSMFLPTLVGTDLGRMYEMARDRDDKVGVVSTVLLDRLMGLLTLVLIALVALLFGYEFVGDGSIPLTIVITTILMVVGWLLFFNRDLMRSFLWVFQLPAVKQLEPTLRSLYNALHHLQSQPRLLISTLFVSILNNFFEILCVIFIARALDVHAEPVYFFLFMPLIWLITTIPISIGGLGLREGVFAFFFNQIGVSSEEAVAMSLLYYGCSVVVGFAGGLAFFRASLTDYAGRAARQQV